MIDRIPRPRVVLEWLAVVLFIALAGCVLAIALALVIAVWDTTL